MYVVCMYVIHFIIIIIITTLTSQMISIDHLDLAYFYKPKLVHTQFECVSVCMTSYTQLVRLDTDVKEILDEIGKKKETYSQVIMRIIIASGLNPIEVKQIA